MRTGVATCSCVTSVERGLLADFVSTARGLRFFAGVRREAGAVPTARLVDA